MKTSNIDVALLPPILNTEEFFALLRVSPSVGYTALNRGDFVFAIRVGRQWRIPRDALLQWLSQDKAAGVGDRSVADDVLRREAFGGR